jgi:hypothetical protein
MVKIILAAGTAAVLLTGCVVGPGYYDSGYAYGYQQPYATGYYDDTAGYYGYAPGYYGYAPGYYAPAYGTVGIGIWGGGGGHHGHRGDWWGGGRGGHGGRGGGRR